MASKKKEELLQPEVQTQAQPAAQSTYSAEGLNSRADVEKAMANVSYRPGQQVTDAADALKQWQQNRPADYQSSYQDKINSLLGSRFVFIGRILRIIDSFGLQRFTINIEIFHNNAFKFLFWNPINCTYCQVVICNIGNILTIYFWIENVIHIIEIQIPEIILTPIYNEHIILFKADWKKIFPTQFPICFIQWLYP